MTESTRGERIQEAGVVGHSYDADDRLGEPDIYEALVNPHDERGAGQKKGGAAGPMMMPMGGTGSGSSAGTSTAAGPTGVAAAKGTSAASSGKGSPAGLSRTGSGGLGGLGAGGYAAGGLGAGGLSRAEGAGASLGGLSSGLGGGLSGSASSWTYPSSGTGAAGLVDPALNQPGSGGPSVPSGGFTIPSPPTTTIPTPAVPATNHGSVPTPTTPPSIGTPSAGDIKLPGAAGGGGGMPSAPGGAFASTANLGVTTVQASPEMLHREAQHWDDTAKEFVATVTDPVGNQSPSSVDFGMMKDAFGSYNDLLIRLKKWSGQAGNEFFAIGDALQSASGGYSDTESTNTATARQPKILE